MSDNLSLVDRIKILEGRVQQLGVEDDYSRFLLDKNLKEIHSTLYKITKSIDHIYGHLCFIETELDKEFESDSVV